MPLPRWPLLTTVAVVLVLPLSHDPVVGSVGALGYAVCHQLPEHSLSVAGLQYPLCARCTGIYLGFLTGLVGLAINGRLGASLSPTGGVAALLFFAIGAMMVDVLNSVISASPDATLLYETTNYIRLGTGLAAGTALALLLVPMLNEALWCKPCRLQSADVPSDLAGYAVLASLIGLAAYSQESILYQPLALATGIGVAAALSTAGAILGVRLVRRERMARSLREASLPLLAGAVLAALLMAALGLLRAQFSISLGM